jgi:hypothetical protein
MRPIREQLRSWNVGSPIMKSLSATIASLALMTGVVGCSAPATRISSGLQRYGLDAPRADCVGERLQSRLSLGQLQRLGKAAAAYRQNDTTPGALTPSDLIRVASELRDPAIALEVGKAAAGCRVLP